MRTSLGEALPREISRNVELLAVYKEIGPAGAFGALMIKSDIDRATEALASGDVVEMLAAYNAMKDNK